jgi:hypothetical protein
MLFLLLLYQPACPSPACSTYGRRRGWFSSMGRFLHNIVIPRGIRAPPPPPPPPPSPSSSPSSSSHLAQGPLLIVAPGGL